jgi:uncharacterized protein (DUF3820 family)
MVPDHSSARAFPHSSTSRPEVGNTPVTIALFTIMSSDYGSDILSDEINAIQDPYCSSALQPKRDNGFATPPPSHKRKACDTPPESQRKLRNVSVVAPRIPVMPLNCPPELPSSQPLPSPYTPPTSSQRTQSQRPMKICQLQTPSSSRPPVPVKCETLSTKQLGEAPPYRFPFGAHRGKTLIEVPENYLTYLRIDDNMANSMPGFASALNLFDAGIPPIAPLPPSRPTQSVEVPSSSAPARVPSSQQSGTPGTTPSNFANTSPSEYRFDFGKHIGKTLNEIPSQYISFLKNRGIVEDKPALAAAVIKHERQNLQSAPPVSSNPSPDQYTLKFGKHVGKTLAEIPEQYLTWLKTTDMLGNNEDLRNAVRHHDKASRRLISKSKPKRQYLPDTDRP